MGSNCVIPLGSASVLKPMPGLPEFMAWIDARGLRKVAVTNAPEVNAVCMLEALGLSTYFETVVFGAKCACGKPFPDPYLEGLKFLGLQADETIAVEDSPSGWLHNS